MKAQRIVEDVVYKVYPNSEKKSAPVHELALRKKKKKKILCVFQFTNVHNRFHGSRERFAIWIDLLTKF